MAPAAIPPRTPTQTWRLPIEILAEIAALLVLVDAAAAFLVAVPEALVLGVVDALWEVAVALPEVAPPTGAVDCPSIWACTAGEKVPDMPDIWYMALKAN